MSSRLSSSPGLRFYREVCRRVPTLIDQFDLGELTTKHRLRRIIAERFSGNRDEKNPDTVKMLIHKGRQELEEYTERFKTRNHVLNEWVNDPEDKLRSQMMTIDRGFTPFLEKFLEGNYSKPKVC